MKFTRWVRRHERLVLVVLTVTLAVTFGAYSVPQMVGEALGRFFRRSGGEDQATAQVLGEPVSEADFYSFLRRWGRFPLAVDNVEQAWTAYAAVRLAERLGVQVSDGELAAFVRSVRAFSDDPADPKGRFSRERYEAFLRQYRMSAEEFEQTAREYVAVLKLQGLLFDAALVTSAEIWPIYRDIHQSYRTASVAYPVGDYLPQVSAPTPEELGSFFQAEKELRYREPERVQVEVLAAAYEGFRTDVEVSEEEARAYYDEHKELFPAPASPQASGDEDRQAEARPFEEVREEIVELLRSWRGQEKAENAVADARKQLVENPGPSFAQMAEASGGKLHAAITGFFARTELTDVPLLGDSFSQGSRFVESLFALDESRRELSVVSPGREAALLCRLLGRQSSRVPELQEVEGQVVSDFKRDRAAELAYKAASKLAEELREKKLSLTSDEVKGRELQVEVSSWYTMDDQEAPAFALRLRGFRAGDIEVEGTQDAIYVVEVLETRPPSQEEFQADRRQQKLYAELANRQWVLPARWDAIVRREAGLIVPEEPPEEEGPDTGEKPAEEPAPPGQNSASDRPPAEQPGESSPDSEATPGPP